MPATDEQKLLAHVMRERKLLAWAFIATGLIFSALILHAWYLNNSLRDIQQQRCWERNHVAETIIKYLPDTVNKQVVLDEAKLPLNCGVYKENFLGQEEVS